MAFIIVIFLNSFDYEDCGFEKAPLVKVSTIINRLLAIAVNKIKLKMCKLYIAHWNKKCFYALSCF